MSTATTIKLRDAAKLGRLRFVSRISGNDDNDEYVPVDRVCFSIEGKFKPGKAGCVSVEPDAETKKACARGMKDLCELVVGAIYREAKNEGCPFTSVEREFIEGNMCGCGRTDADGDWSIDVQSSDRTSFSMEGTEHDAVPKGVGTIVIRIRSVVISRKGAAFEFLLSDVDLTPSDEVPVDDSSSADEYDEPYSRHGRRSVDEAATKRGRIKGKMKQRWWDN